MKTDKNGKCILIGAGDLTVGQIPRSNEDFVIVVDGGLGYCEFLGIEPDLILGDFDSVTDGERQALESIETQCPEKVIRLKPEKDDTDMLYAIKYALERGYREFRIYAATGGRFDHTLANIQCLLYLKNHDAVGYLMDGNGMILALQNESVAFRENMEGYVSLFSLGKKAEGVTIKGLKYELENATISNDFPIGISNEFIGKKAEVSVENGELVCMISYPS
ncbi:MAG: thiamine diphosphokinase [Lachnospiraceae bacterium]|nr:thiamine diphosphokinase [Lachnospiraceae bacterium]